MRHPAGLALHAASRAILDWTPDHLYMLQPVHSPSLFGYHKEIHPRYGQITTIYKYGIYPSLLLSQKHNHRIFLYNSMLPWIPDFLNVTLYIAAVNKLFVHRLGTRRAYFWAQYLPFMCTGCPYLEDFLMAFRVIWRPCIVSADSEQKSLLWFLIRSFEMS